MINKTIVATTCVSALLFTGFVQANDAAELKAKLSELNSLHSKFKQTVVDVNHKIIQQGEGVFALATPNKLYWHLTQPDESLIVADGKDVWIFNPFAEEATVMDLEQAITSSPMTLLIHHDDKTWSNYQVKKSGNCFNITPMAADVNVTSVESCFENQELAKFVIHDAQGNTSTFDLSKQRPMTNTEAKLFDFVPPKHVDIDDQRSNKLQH